MCALREPEENEEGILRYIDKISSSFIALGIEFQGLLSYLGTTSCLCDTLLNSSGWYIRHLTRRVVHRKGIDWIPAFAEKHPSHGKKVLGGMTEPAPANPRGGTRSGGWHADSMGHDAVV
jgi:hypothetical protein